MERTKADCITQSIQWLQEAYDHNLDDYIIDKLSSLVMKIEDKSMGEAKVKRRPLTYEERVKRKAEYNRRYYQSRKVTLHN
jgi:hypothetical protein